MLDIMKLRPFLKASTGIGRGHRKRKNMGKSSAKTQKELKQTKAELAQSQEALRAKEAELQETQEMLRTVMASYDELEARIKSMNTQVVGSAKKVSSKYVEPTQANFRAVYDELHTFRKLVRICDLRRSLNWPREVFDEMIHTLRDNRIIQISKADESMLTQEEIQDCFIDENRFIQGYITWNGR